MPWEAIKYVSSGVTLLAFIAVIILQLYRRALLSRERLIVRATERIGLNINQPRSSGYRLQFTERSVPGPSGVARADGHHYVRAGFDPYRGQLAGGRSPRIRIRDGRGTQPRYPAIRP